jgi:hypothetical protein
MNVSLCVEKVFRTTEDQEGSCTLMNTHLSEGSDIADLSVGTLHNILLKELKMRKVNILFLHKLMFVLQGKD